MAEDDDILEGLGDEGEEAGDLGDLADAVSDDDAALLEEAVASDGDDSDEELDPLAEEMLKMMEEEGDEAGGGEDVDQMMEMEMLKAMKEETGGGEGVAVAASGGAGLPPNIERLMDVLLTVTIELGRTKQTIEKVMEYGDQSLIEMDKTVGEPVDVRVNGEIFARGEVVTVSENFGVRITELVSPVPHLG